MNLETVRMCKGRHVTRKLTRIASIILLSCVAVGASFQAQAESELRVSSSQDPGSWDPIDTFMVAWATVATNVFDGLTYRGPDMTLQPGLATAWQVSADGKKIRFDLRRNVSFHNGEPFNANAVKFTFDRILGEEGRKGPQYANYKSIEQVVVIDDYTVDFVLNEVDPVLLTKLAGYGGMIVPPHYIEEYGDDYFNLNPVGTGPFKMDSYTPKREVELSRFDDFWGDKAQVDKLTFRFFSDNVSAVTALQAGYIDIVPPPVPIAMIPTLRNDNAIQLISTPGPGVYAFRFNTARGITTDESVRKALIMAVDRESIVRYMLEGQGELIASFQGSSSLGFDPNLAPYPYDPAEAKRLLKAAGVPEGARVELDVRGNDATFVEIAQAVAAYLGVVDINASIRPLETSTYLNEIVPQGKTGALFQQAWGGWTFDYDNTAYAMYHSGQKWNPYGTDSTLDAMLEHQRGLIDPAQREQELQAISRYVAEHALEMPIFNLNATYAVSQRVANFEAAPDSRMRLNRVSVE